MTANEHGIVQLWDAASGHPGLSIEEHRGPVVSVAFSPDGRYLATASWDHTARLWNAALSQEAARLETPSGKMWQVAFAPDGRHLVAASEDGTARVWDIEAKRQVAIMVGHESDVRHAAFSPDGRRVLTAADDHTARLWDAATGELIAVLKGFGGPVVMDRVLPERPGGGRSLHALGSPCSGGSICPGGRSSIEHAGRGVPSSLRRRSAGGFLGGETHPGAGGTLRRGPGCSIADQKGDPDRA